MGRAQPAFCPARSGGAPARRRQRSTLRPASLFGFGGSKPESTTSQQPQAPAVQETGPVLIPFTPIQKTKDYTLRLYNAYTAAEAEYERRDEGFLLLGSYMSGNNAAAVRCRETQPVIMCYPPQGPKRMQVYIVPRSSSGGSGSDAAPALPPAPTDPAVSLAVAGGQVVAVRQFEGNATQEACERCRKQLVAALERDGLKLAEEEAAGYFRLAQYGPLHSLSPRLNEIMLAVKL